MIDMPLSDAQPRQLVIDRSRWARGDKSCLLDSQTGQMCCLGFVALAYGVSAETIRDVSEPSELSPCDVPPAYCDAHFDCDSCGDPACNCARYTSKEAVLHAIVVNDSPTLTDPEREVQLTPILQHLGFDEVLFVDQIASGGAQ